MGVGRSGLDSSVVGAPFRNLGKFVYPTLPVYQCLSDETLYQIVVPSSGVYARRSEISHTGGQMCNLSWTPHSTSGLEIRTNL